MTSRELLHRTLEFRNTSERVPRDLWSLPWARIHHGPALDALIRDFEWDFAGPPVRYAQELPVEGDSCAVGDFTDEWGCTFHNIQAGVIGEVKAPLVTGEEWEDAEKIHIPNEHLSFDPGPVNEFCRASDKFVMAGCCPRPFERLQFIRGSEATYVDLMLRPPRMMEFLDRMHQFHCEQIEKWAQTEVDAISFMDDWGTQRGLLISPELWRELFKPMYRDYIAIAKAHGKKTFMHSDGHTLAILPDLVEIGLDAMNAQLFCMGVENLAPFRGKLTFWGEIDRQHLLPHATLEEIDRAVDLVHDTLWAHGGCIAQCEFGPAGRPENVRRVYERWSRLEP